MALSACGIDWGDASIRSPDDCTEFCDRYLRARDAAASGLAIALVIVWTGFGVAFAAHATRRRWDSQSIWDPPRTAPLAAAAITAVMTLAYFAAVLS